MIENKREEEEGEFERRKINGYSFKDNKFC